MKRRYLLMQSETAGAIALSEVDTINTKLANYKNWKAQSHWNMTACEIQSYQNRACCTLLFNLTPGSYKLCKKDTMNTPILKMLYRRYNTSGGVIKTSNTADPALESLEFTIADKSERFAIAVWNDSAGQGMYDLIKNGSVRIYIEKV